MHTGLLFSPSVTSRMAPIWEHSMHFGGIGQALNCSGSAGTTMVFLHLPHSYDLAEGTMRELVTLIHVPWNTTQLWASSPLGTRCWFRDVFAARIDRRNLEFYMVIRKELSRNPPSFVIRRYLSRFTRRYTRTYVHFENLAWQYTLSKPPFSANFYGPGQLVHSECMYVLHASK